MGPTLAGSGVNIYMPEPCCWDSTAVYADTTALDSGANSFVFAYAAHDYDTAFDVQPIIPLGKHIWMTEITDYVNPGLDTSMASGITIAQEIHNLLTVSNIKGWIYWLMLGNGTGFQTTNQCLICNGVNSKRLYAIGKLQPIHSH